MTASGWARPCADERVDDVAHPAREVAEPVAQPHPQLGGDLVVARPPRPQLAAEVRADPLDQPALEGGVDVLVVLGGHERPRRDVGGEPREAVEHPGELVVVEQPRAVQHAGVRAGAGDVVGRQDPVELGGLRQRRHHRVGAGGEPPAPERRGARVARLVGLAHPSSSSCAVVVAPGRPAALVPRARSSAASSAPSSGSRATTTTVSSPAIVPTTSASAARSSALAR